MATLILKKLFRFHRLKLVIPIGLFCFVYMSVYGLCFGTTYFIQLFFPNVKHQVFEDCSCKRRFYHNLSWKPNRDKVKSTCSDEASWNNVDQKVISYALYIPSGKENYTLIKIFKKGILENLKRMRVYYPGYVMRLYTDINLEGEFCKMVCDNVDLHWCDIRNTPIHGDLSKMYFMTWRFLPLGDETVEVFHSRDLDSLISAREASAVSDWFENYPNRSIQVMRDHQNHNFMVLGGLWGANNMKLGKRRTTTMQLSIINMSSAEIPGVTEKKGLDQIVLYKTLFLPHFHKHVVAYDSYHCKKWQRQSKILIRPFPSRRLDSSTDFVGNTELGLSKHNLEPCPVECRPSYGKHWVYC